MVFFIKLLLRHKVCHKTDDKKGNDNDGKYIGYVAAHPIFYLPSTAGVGFLHKLLPTPAPLAHREDHKDQRAQRQQNIADQEVLQVQERGAPAQGVNLRQEIKAQRTGQGQDQQQQAVDQAGLFPAPSTHVHTAGEDVFKDRQHRRKRGKGHKHKEQRAPKISHRHVIEHVGQRNKDQARP